MLLKAKTCERVHTWRRLRTTQGRTQQECSEHSNFQLPIFTPNNQFNQEIAKHENRTSKMNFAAQEDKANDVLNVDEFNNGIQSQVREIDWLKSHQSFHFFVVASKRGGFG